MSTNPRFVSLPKHAYATGLFALTLTTLMTYWGWRLYTSVWRQVDDALPDLGELVRYLLGVILTLNMFWGLAHLNYRLAFRRWLLRRQTRFYYWAWLCVLAWALFELLQWRTDQEPDFVDENILVTGVLTAVIVLYGYGADSLRTRRERLQLIQQKTEAELTALKAQVNPHFLFNALNTIYNEAQSADNEYVADLIQQLSGIMRFTLQEAQQPVTAVENELQFLEKYLALQRARLPQTENFKLTTRLDWDGQPAQIAPLLLIPFIENAFQYGISFTHPSYVDLDLSIENRQLRMRVVNSVPPGTTPKRGTGIGIPNARQRLALMYPARHDLRVDQTNDSFVVQLCIDL